MTRRWPGWEDNLQGMEIAPVAQWAADNGHKQVACRAVCGPSGAHGSVDCFTLIVTAAGAVTVWAGGDTWGPVVEDGYIKGVHCSDPDVTYTMVRVPYLVIPTDDKPKAPALVEYTPAAFGMCAPSGDLLNAIDASGNEDGTRLAALSVMSCGPDGQVTVAAWPLTYDSAASVVAMITERHGEPMAEWLTDTEGADAVSAVAADIGVHTCVHVREDDGEDTL